METVLGQCLDLSKDNFIRLLKLKLNPIFSSDGQLSLEPAKPHKWNNDFYLETFSDSDVTRFLTISPDFDGGEFINKCNGQVESFAGGSPKDVLYHIYVRGKQKGPVGHVTIKDIDWERLTFHRGMVIKKPFWGLGIGSKAGYLVLENMQKLGFKRALTEVKAGNDRSLNVVRKQFGDGILGDDGRYHFELDLSQPLVFNPFEQEQ